MSTKKLKEEGTEAADPKVGSPRKPHWPKEFEPTGDPIADTKRLLELGPKTAFMCPLQPGEDPRSVEIAQINGYKLTIKKGVMVEIPLPMAQLLAEKYKVELMVAQKAIGASDSAAQQALDA